MNSKAELEGELRAAAAERPRGKEIRAMFASISPRYDLLNRVLSGCMDIRWRNAAVRAAVGANRGSNETGSNRIERVLDVCTGTGDLALTVSKRLGDRVEVVGVDFCPEMLQGAKRKQDRAALRSAGRVHLAVSDAQELPFPVGSFDAALVAFGIRNVANVHQGLAEMVRVVRPGGRVVILEFSRPENPLARVVTRAALGFVPWIGKLLCRAEVDAYGYLSRSVQTFGRRFDLKSQMEDSGLVQVQAKPQTLGAVTVYSGEKPSPSPG